MLKAEKLNVWQEAISLAAVADATTLAFPEAERFGLILDHA